MDQKNQALRLLGTIGPVIGASLVIGGSEPMAS